MQTNGGGTSTNRCRRRPECLDLLVPPHTERPNIGVYTIGESRSNANCPIRPCFLSWAIRDRKQAGAGNDRFIFQRGSRGRGRRDRCQAPCVDALLCRPGKNPLPLSTRVPSTRASLSLSVLKFTDTNGTRWSFSFDRASKQPPLHFRTNFSEALPLFDASKSTVQLFAWLAAAFSTRRLKLFFIDRILRY